MSFSPYYNHPSAVEDRKARMEKFLADVKLARGGCLITVKDGVETITVSVADLVNTVNQTLKDYKFDILEEIDFWENESDEYDDSIEDE